MFCFRYLARLRGVNSPVLPNSCRVYISSSSASYSDPKDPADIAKDDDASKSSNRKTVDLKKTNALNKLNTLLTTMVSSEYVSSTTKALNDQLARPKRKLREKLEEEAKKSTEPEPIVTAAKRVAESLGGDVRQTESELLIKLRLHTSVEERKKSVSSLNELIVGMKIDREKKPPVVEGRASQVRRILDGRRGGGEREVKGERRDGRRGGEEGRGRYEEGRGRHEEGRGRYEDRGPSERRQTTPPQRVNLFDQERLGIFTASDATTPDVELSTWQTLHERELRLAVTHPPANVFEEMIMWTEQGKLWQFPIDNEQGLEEEHHVYFADHVFLEPLLDSWCPKRGPVRHFMELVCVGLSKNPYLTVQEKRDHIEWFQEYFKQKQDVLLETGALEAEASAKLSP